MAVILKQSTSIDVRIGPFVDVGDGFTPEVGITLGAADEAEALKADGAATVDISARTWAAVTGADGWYDLTLSTADTDTIGELVIVIHDDSVCLPVFQRFQVVEEAVYDALFASGGVAPLSPTTAGRTLDVTATGAAGIDWANVEAPTTANNLSGTTVNLVNTATDVTNIVTANATQISGSAASADNMELLYNGVEGFAAAYMGPRGPGVYFNDVAANTNTTNGTDGTFANPVSTIGAAKTLADSMTLDRIYIVNDSAVTLAATMTDYEFVGIGVASGNVVTLGAQDVTNSTFVNLQVTGTQGGTGRMLVTDGIVSGVTTFHGIALRCGIDGTTTLGTNDDNFFDACYSMVAGNGTPQLTFAANADVGWRHYSGGLQINSMASTNAMSFESDGQMVIDATCSGGTLLIRGNCSLTDNAGGAVTVTQTARTALGDAIPGSPTADSTWERIAAIDDLTQSGGGGDLAAILADTASLDGTKIPDTISLANINTEVDTALADVNLDHLVGTAAPGIAPAGTYIDILADDGTATYDRTTDSLQAIRDKATDIETDTADIQTRLPAALVSGKMDSDATSISGDSTAADRLEALMDGVLTAACEGTPSTTVIQTDLAETTDDQYIGRLVTFLTGNAAGEQTDITDYTGSTGTITVTALANAPAAADLLVIH